MALQIPNERQYIVFWLDVEQTLAIAGEGDDSSLLQSARNISTQKYAGLVLDVRSQTIVNCLHG